MPKRRGNEEKAKEKVKMEKRAGKGTEEEIRRGKDVIYSPELVHTC